MKQPYLETGKIVNTHGIHGEVKIVPWADSPEFLCQFKTIYIDGVPHQVRSAYVHKSNVIARLAGIDTIDDAIALKEKVISIARADVPLEPGQFFLTDLMGCQVRDADTGAILGEIVDILTPPANNVYVVRGRQEFMIPAVPEFILETNVDEGYLTVRLIEGMMPNVQD